MNELRYRKAAAFRENFFVFWLLFCQHVIFFQVVSFLCSAFIHPFYWSVIIAGSFGGSFGWFFRRESRPFPKLD
jgi:hypothetical protein